MKTFTHVFAVPGESSVIDVVNPATGRSAVNDQTLAEMQQRYPNAARIDWTDWQKARAEEQDTPIEWAETTEEQYNEMLNVLPPAFWTDGLFLVGEPMDHHVMSGQPRFTVYRQIGSRYFVASRPMTSREAKAVIS